MKLRTRQELTEIASRFHNLYSSDRSGDIDQAIELLNQIQDNAVRTSAHIASKFSVKPDRNLHPDIPWNLMNDTSQTVAHSAAQSICMEILATIEGEEEA